MAKGLSILEFSSSEEMPPGIGINYEKAFALIPTFKERYEDLKDCFSQKQHIDHKKLEELRDLNGDFFWVWTISSPIVVSSLGGELVLKMLELFSKYRNITWGQDFLDYFHQLPESIEIFRGGSSDLNTVLKGFSWSLHRNIAETFMDENKGVLVRAKINRDDILLVSATEAELVPRPDCLIDPQVIS